MNREIIPNVEVDTGTCYGEMVHINDLIQYLEQLKLEALRVYESDNIFIVDNEYGHGFEFGWGIIAQETPKMYKQRLAFLDKIVEQEEQDRIADLKYKEKNRVAAIRRIKQEAKEYGLEVIG